MSEEYVWDYEACGNSGHAIASKIDHEIRPGAVCWRCVVAEREVFRASNAALLAENEAAVKNMAALQSELAAFKNRQPSDPGTKEAIRELRMVFYAQKWEDRWIGYVNTIERALRTAMVRLEESEEEIRLSREIWARVGAASDKVRDENAALKAENETLKEAVSGRTEAICRAVTAESQVSALTARLEEAEKKI